MRELFPGLYRDLCASMLVAGAVAAGMAATPGARAQGLIFDDPASHARLPAQPRYRAYLPPRVDLARWFPTPGSQGRLGSCVGWAVAYARSYYAVRFFRSKRYRRADLPSPAYIYGAITRPANCTRGSAIPHALLLLKNRGAPSAAEFPYNQYRCPAPLARRLGTRPTYRRFGVTTAYRIGRRGNRYKPRLDDVKGVLARGHPVIFGMRLSKRFHRLRGNQVWRGRGRLRRGGHAMTLVGYDERRQAFKVINSWGTRWGNRGFGWIGYGAFRRYTRYAYYMRVARPPRPKPVVRPKRRPKIVRPKPKRVVKPRPKVRPKPKPKPRPVVRFNPPLKYYKCAGLQVSWHKGRPKVRGFVSSAADLARLRSAAGRAKAGLAVHVRPWPQCEVLLTFRRVFRAAGAPQLEIVGNRTKLKKGDQLVIRVTTPAKPAYLYLVFIQASGGVVYLAQPGSSVAAPMAPGRQFTFGDGGGFGRFIVSPPYGNEMVLAIASASPLFDKARPDTEIERDFLTAFRRAFLYRPEKGAKLRDVAASWIALTTREK